MAEDQTAPVRVMRRTDNVPPAIVETEEGGTITFSTTLSNGRVITLRELSAADLLYMEKTLAGAGDMERSLKLCVRLSTADGKVSFEDLQKLKMKDLRKVTDLLGKAGGTDEEDSDPNF